MSGLSFDATQEDIEEFFQEKGKCEILNVKLLTQFNGKSKGMAFVKVGSKSD